MLLACESRQVVVAPLPVPSTVALTRPSPIDFLRILVLLLDTVTNTKERLKSQKKKKRLAAMKFPPRSAVPAPAYVLEINKKKSDRKPNIKIEKRKLPSSSSPAVHSPPT
jgi:hypothetical protein